MYICEKCNSNHNGEYGSGRFCSQKCSKSYSTSLNRISTNKKISKSIKGSGSEEIKTFLSFKKGMKDVSEFAKKQNKHFVIVNYDINNLTGFPINNYNDLKSYCFKKDRDNSIRINCSSMKRMGKGAVEINFILVDNADYRIYSYNSDEVLESIKNEK